MKKMLIVAAMFVAATMVACCGNQNAKECDKECCEQKTECCEKAECEKQCEKKAECAANNCETK
jgi:hypothetical protein